MNAIERLESFCSDIYCTVSPYRTVKMRLQRDECDITFRELRLYAFYHNSASRKRLVGDCTIQFGSVVVAERFQRVMQDLGFQGYD